MWIIVLMTHSIHLGERERNVLFNDALNTIDSSRPLVDLPHRFASIMVSVR